MEPLFYFLSTFWGYRLLKQSAQTTILFHKVLSTIFGIILLEGPWVVISLNISGQILLSISLFAIGYENIRGPNTGKRLYDCMSDDEKIFLWVTAIFSIGWIVYLFMQAIINIMTVL
jgi:hypothetical protein